MKIQHLFTTMIVAIALMVGMVACTPAASTTPTPPAADTGGTEDTESSDVGPVDDSNGMGMNDLIGNWQAVDITGEPVAGTVIPTLSFGANGEVAGNGGCNGYGGTYTSDGSEISIVGVVSTMMACEDQAMMTQETNFLSTLQLASSYTIDGDTLTLIDTDGNTILTLSRVG
jgi:heat shock protein HslJ